MNARQVGSIRLLWSLILGIGLALGLLWVLVPRSVAQIQPVGAGSAVGLVGKAARNEVASAAVVEVASTSASPAPAIVTAPPASGLMPIPPRVEDKLRGDREMRHDGPSSVPVESGIPTAAPAGAPGDRAPDSGGAAGGLATALLATNSFTEPYIVLEKNADYYDAAGVVITQVTGLYIGEDEAWTRYKAGQLDDIVPPVSALDEITEGSVYSAHLHVYPSGYTYYYGFSNDVPPLDNAQLRAALASAIDRQRLISDVLEGDELLALTFVAPGSFGHVDGYAKGVGRPYSPTVAVSLLAGSGYTGTPPITLMYNSSPVNQAVAEAVRQMWFDTLAISVTLEEMDWSSYLDLLRDGSASERPGVFRLGWGADYPDADNWLYEVFHSTGHNWARYNNPSYDALVEAAASEPVSATRLSQYEQAEAYLVMTDTAIAPLYYNVNRSLTRPDLTRTYRPFGGQHVDEWDFAGPSRPLEIAGIAPHTLDPALAFDSYVEQLFLGLTDFDEEGNPLPELAIAWEASPDLTVYTFTMRNDVTWANSISVVTAYDVEYGVLRSLDPNTDSGYAYVLYIIENALDYNQGNITDPSLVGVEALDNTHIRFTLTRPAAFFPVIAGLPPARPVPQWAIDAYGDAWTDAGNIVTNGSYKLAAWEQAPYLRIQKEANGNPLEGSSFVFTVRYWNDSGAPAEGVVITDSILGGMTYVSDTSPFTHSGSGNGPIVWYLGTLPAHSSGQFDIQMQITAPGGNSVTNRVQIATSNPYAQGETESEWSGQVEGPGMRVNYGHDWVGGDYEAGHTFSITVTDSSHALKATGVVNSEAGKGWGGPGFETGDSEWSPERPDIEPGDLVTFQSDDGYTNVITVGVVSGCVDEASDTITGTVTADFPQTVTVECHPWGGPGDAPVKEDQVLPNGADVYSCSWDPGTEWDIQKGQDVAAMYIEPDDGDRVINVFQAPWLEVRVNQSHHWVDGRTLPGSTIVATVWRDGLPILAEVTSNGGGNDWNINFPGDDESRLRAGDVVEVQTSQGLTASIEIVAMTGAVDADADTISGQVSGVSYPADLRGEVWTEGGPSVDDQTDGSGNYTVDFSSSFDVLPGHPVALWYVRPDGHQVCIVRSALCLLVDAGADRVEGETTPGVPVTATLNGGETHMTTSDDRGQFSMDFDGDIVAADTVEAWAGAGTQYASLTVASVTAFVDDGADKVWGYAPPGDGSTNNMNVSVNGDWQPTASDGSGYYEISYGYDITPNDDLEVEYTYPEGHRVRHGFGPSDLNVDKQADLRNVSPGDEFSYSIHYSNNASGPATGVVITDTLPFSVTYLWDTSGVTPTVDPVHNTVVWQQGALGGHRSQEFEMRVRVETGAPMYTNLRNEVEIACSDDRDPGNNYSGWDVNVGDPQADLWVEKAFEPSLEAGVPLAGGVITYQIRYGNNGNQAASNVLLTDTLPVSVTVAATTFEVGVDGLSESVGASVVVWNIGSLDPGESREFELALQIDGAAAPGTLLFDEIIIAGDNDGGELRDNWYRHTVMVEPEVADLYVDKGVEGDFSSIENEFVYRILFRNNGTTDAQSVVVTDTLPLSMTLLWHSAGSAATVAGNVVVWDLGALPPGAGGTLLVGVQVSGTVPVGTLFTNTVEAETVSTELDYDNNMAVDVLGPPKVICVPWLGTRPHRVWARLESTLKGTAKGYGLTSFEWDPGDGSPPISGSVGDLYAVEALHSYSAPVGTVYTATLTVWGAFGWSDADTYVVQLFQPFHGVQVDVAIDEGLWYVHKSANRYNMAGYPFADWQNSSNGVAETASAVQAFQVQGHRPGGDPWEDPYVEDVQRGWNTLFTNAVVDPMSMQPLSHDPDGDGDGVGIGMYMDYSHAIYESGLAMMALATTGSPSRTVQTGPYIHVRGQSYYSITQDMADWFAWGQNDAGSGDARGGWRYQPNSGDSDNSNTQFPVLGLIAAEDNWGITVPSWVKTELRDYWLAFTQNTEGAFGYMDPNNIPNVGKTGAGIMNLVWTGVPLTDTRIISASHYIETHWSDPIDMNNQGGNVGDYYAMYAVKKGSQVAGIHYYGPYLWDYEYCAYLVGIQAPDGSFDEDPNLGLYFHNWQPMATSWALMILSPGLYRPLPVPIVAPIHYGWQNGEIQFDASLSHHTDPDRAIAFFEWNFGDGSGVVTATNPIITHTYTTRNIYIATLTAWDDVGASATRATQVNVTAPNGAPVADPDGPYVADLYQELVLDGSGSYDPDETIGDRIELYEWHITSIGTYTTTVPTLARTWTSHGLFTVTLRVRDRGSEYGLDSPKWSDPAETTVTINSPADLWLAKRDEPDPAVVHEVLTYTITVFNHGPAPATNVFLTDTLPGSASFVSVASTAFTCNPTTRTVACHLANLAAFDTATVTIRVTPNVTGTIFNFALVRAAEVDTNLGNNSELEATVVTEAPVLDPIVSSVTPHSGLNDAATAVTILGSNFQSGATASLDGTPLQSVVVANNNRIQATVPAGMTPGSFDLTVTNPDSRSGILLNAFTVLAPTPPVVTSISPAQGPNDTPVTMDIYGANFAPGLTVTLSLPGTVVPVEGVLFINGSRLRGIVPIYTAPGVYTVTVTNTDGRSGALPNAYRAVEAAVSDDLYANRPDFWLRPLSVRQGNAAPIIGLTVRRQGGAVTLMNVPVNFYVGNPAAGGTLIGAGSVPSLAPGGVATATVLWTPPPSAGAYVLYAWIDPTDVVAEDNETNNIISRTVTVLPPLPDGTPPTVDSFSVNGGAANTTDQQVYLTVSAHDNVGGSGVALVLYVEYEFVQSAAGWVAVADSGWLPYATAHTNHPWLLQPEPGVRYLKAWVADGAGNISPQSKAQLINYTPPVAYVAQGQVHIYRQRLSAGQILRVRLTMSHGDADLYVWAPNGSLVGYSWADNPEVIEFTASMDGVYQIEVEGWTGAYYRLEIVPISAVQMRAAALLYPLRGRGTPFLPPDNEPGDDTGLPSAPVTQYPVFLPLVMCNH